MQPTYQQLEQIRSQLGRAPRGIAAIAKTSDSGTPLVLQMRSLVNDKPFPTLYWLSSRDLSREIGRIEMTGWIKRFEDELSSDSSLMSRYRQQQQNYVDQRWQLMDPSDKARIVRLGFSEIFDQVGIGGLANWGKVRCLHMQYAHHLVGDNLVGARLDAEFGLNNLEPSF